MEYSAFFPLWANRKLNSMHLFAYGPSIMDADLIIGSLYDSSGRVYWTDPKVDQLAKQQRSCALRTALQRNPCVRRPGSNQMDAAA